jgi:ornithine cyclodeaminase
MNAHSSRPVGIRSEILLVSRSLPSARRDHFARWHSFDKTPRLASHSTEGVVELMPTSDGVPYGFKYVNGHPENPERGFQTVAAFGVLADVSRGCPMFLTDMTILTALRTAAKLL